MPSISIKITNLPQIKAAFGKSPMLMAKELNLAIRRIVLNVGAQSRRNTPVQTGRLRASTYERFSNLQGEVGTDTKYDKFVHYGTRYMPARPYLADAVSQNEGYIDRQFKDAVQSVLNAIGRAT